MVAAAEKTLIDVFERARVARDARFDGRFFVGVRTTGIYCRPVCPANLPKPENVRFFPSAAAAGEAGYRPCLRCRPECAPGTPAWAGTSTTVRRGLRLIAAGALDDGGVDALAMRLGVTDRHLRRLFQKHVGASPQAIAGTQRLQFAKRLVDDTELPLKEVAIAAGYGSVRRFNDAFRSVYGRPPRDLRRARRAEAPVAGGAGLTVALPHTQPLDWEGLCRWFSPRLIPGIEALTDGRYRRAVRQDGRVGQVSVGRNPASGLLELTVHGFDAASLFTLVQRTREMFDLDAPVADIEEHLKRDPLLEARLRSRPVPRIPGAWDGFELAVRAILGQQVSVRAATTLARRIVDRYGEAAAPPSGGADALRVFPAPARLASARLDGLGIVRRRADTIRRLARAVLDGSLDFDTAEEPAAFCERLMALPGIGAWTAEYVAMRALKHPDAFPSSDLGLIRALSPADGPRPRPADLEARAEAWRPWRAYAALVLWNSDPEPGG